MNEKTIKKIAPYQLFLSAFGMGYMPFAPGTWGSAWTALIFLLVALAGGNSPAATITLVILAGYGCWATIYFGDEGIKNYGDDPGMIVSDEVAGQAITLFWIYQWGQWSVGNIFLYTAVGFVLFRIFDIIKPWPACYFDRLKSKWGVLLDDIVAGVYAAIVLQIVWHLSDKAI